jgi:hypothetical protein
MSKMSSLMLVLRESFALGINNFVVRLLSVNEYYDEINNIYVGLDLFTRS